MSLDVQLSFITGDDRTLRPRPVFAAHTWDGNADLIADCARVGHLCADWLTLDATYGEGTWWKSWRPDRLITNDRFKAADTRADFRALPYATGTFDAVIFDPPYVTRGGRATIVGALKYRRWQALDEAFQVGSRPRNRPGTTPSENPRNHPRNRQGGNDF